MKNLIFTLLLLASVPFYAQEKKEEITTTQTERIIDKYGGKIIEQFNAVIEKSTPLAEDGFRMVVKLQYARGIGFLLPSILFIIFLVLFNTEYKSVKKEIGESDYGPFDEVNITPQLILYLSLSIILFIVACVDTVDGILYLFAPEWFAIKEILDLF